MEERNCLRELMKLLTVGNLSVYQYEQQNYCVA